MRLVQRVPASLLTVLLQVYILLGHLFMFLIATLWGTLLLSILIYVYFQHYGPIQPYGFLDLVDWLIALPRDYKIALSTSLLTILGFLIAFHAANLNWKHQLQTQLQIDAAVELEATYSDAASLITEAEIFAEYVLDTLNLRETDPPLEELDFRVRYTLSKLQEFLNVRQEILELSTFVYRLSGKHGTLLARHWGAQSQIDQINKALSLVAEKIWVPIPYIDVNLPNYIDAFFRQLNKQQYQDLVEACQKTHGYISGMSGAVKGRLFAPVTPLNIWGLISIIRSYKALKSFVATLQKPPTND